MEGILWGTAAASFVLAFGSFVASGVIFVKADVMGALRFLRHRAISPVSASRSQSALSNDAENSLVRGSSGRISQPHCQQGDASVDASTFGCAVTMPMWLSPQREEAECLN